MILEMSYYRPPQRRAKTLAHIRMPEELKEALGTVVRLWKIRAQASGRDPDLIDLTYVCNTLLQVGVDGAWAEALSAAGLERLPETDKEWEQLARSLAAPKQ